jgi:hypothetical protein
MGTLIALDDYAQDALAEYVATNDEMRELATRKDKARDALIAFFESNDADVGTVDGKEVVKLIRSDVITLDTERLKAEQPFTYRKFAKPAVRKVYIRQVPS